MPVQEGKKEQPLRKLTLVVSFFIMYKTKKGVSKTQKVSCQKEICVIEFATTYSHQIPHGGPYTATSSCVSPHFMLDLAGAAGMTMSPETCGLSSGVRSSMYVASLTSLSLHIP